jgi:hypothetical protein
MTHLSASGIMMSSQLGNENTVGERTDRHDSCSDLVVDIFRRLPSRVWSACLAVAQASCAILEVRALRDPVAWPYAWPCTPGILAVGGARLVRSPTASRKLDVGKCQWLGFCWRNLWKRRLHSQYLDENERIAKGLRTQGFAHTRVFVRSMTDNRFELLWLA